ncbi:MAG: hypothetical protein H6741_02225 [Alphaproteobacteria bacterium]|nr:hypothetical protein [Alphaproteobacteria bacterium]MCB9791520.1 hypothetical protein [Alphaproteobacteria bacterium]
MRAYTCLRAPDGSLHELVHGDLIGRLSSAALCLDDGRVSEAHAMISLREQELRLIALRGALAVRGKPCSEVALEPGMKVLLARGLALVVEEVVLPEVVLGLEGEGLSRQVLPPVCSLLLAPRPHLAKGWAGEADAWIWCAGEGPGGSSWRVRRPGEGARGLEPGDTLELSGLRFQAVAVPLESAGQAATRRFGGVDAPLHIVASFDTVHIHRDGDVVMGLNGVLARVVSELVAFGGPVAWTVLAEQLWPREKDPTVLRPRLDVNLSRLRRKLREARVRTDLVRSDGAGQVELLLYPHDQVEDRT